MPWDAFWRRHVFLLKSTAQMVETQEVHLTSRASHRSPIPYMIKTTAFVTTALTIAGGSWYVAVNLTTASDLTAIYNCSAFFAYAFSIPLLKEKLRFDKVFAVGVAIIGVLVVAYGDRPDKKVSKGGTTKDDQEAQNRLLGNIVIGIGSVLYGLYEVLYKRFACPPEGTSPGRGTIFANTFGSMIGCFTLLVLWVPLPFLHFLGWETFRFPTGEAGWMLLISICANASKCSRSMSVKVIRLTPPSVLRVLPGPHLPHITRPFVRCGSPDHLPGGHRRLAAHGTTPFFSGYHWRHPDHGRLLFVKLEYIPGTQRGAQEAPRERRG